MCAARFLWRATVMSSNVGAAEEGVLNPRRWMMAQMSLAEIPHALGTVFMAGDPAVEGKAQERFNVEQLQRMVQAISQGRFDELRERLAPDVAYEMAAPKRFPWRRTASGAEEVAAAIAENFASVCEQRTQPLSLVSQGDTVMVMAREAGRLVDSGRRYDILLAQQFTFGGDGRLAGFRAVANDVAHPPRTRRPRR
jgi:ketosteroid isomerase-like protein